jgi:hypothetical protein
MNENCPLLIQIEIELMHKLIAHHVSKLTSRHIYT